MAMAIAPPHYTIADLDAFPEDGNRYEIVAGHLLVTPSPSFLHQGVLARLVGKLAGYLETEGLAMVVSPGVVQMGDDTQLEPDGLVVPSRFPIGLHWRSVTERWLAIEVSGRDSRIYDRDYKQTAYLELGVREVWRVDLRDQAVYVSRQEHPAEVKQDTRLEWHPPEMAAGLAIDIIKLFAGSDQAETGPPR